MVLSSTTVVTKPGPDGARLLTITRHLRELLTQSAPAEASLEELFMGRNATSAIGVAQARGAILAALAAADIPVHEYKPAHIKATLTGYGMAGKTQMARMLALQGVRQKMDDHAADAVAVAICHARSRRLLSPPPSWGRARVGADR
jgi:crossover junction endodeoxyribonuclease RuvC